MVWSATSWPSAASCSAMARIVIPPTPGALEHGRHPTASRLGPLGLGPLGDLLGPVEVPAPGVVLAECLLQQRVGIRPDHAPALGDLADRVVLDPEELDRQDATLLALLDDPGARMAQPGQVGGDLHVIGEDGAGVALGGGAE